jgi:cytochrome c oxidase subunit 3
MSSAITAQEAKGKAWGGGRSPFNVSYGKIMIWYFLMSDAFTFGAFLISYGTTRFFSHVWPDPNMVFHGFPLVGNVDWPLVFVSLMTFILILSSVTMVLAVHAGHCMDQKGVIKWMTLTVIGGLAFLGCQAWEWTHLHHTGAWWGSIPADWKHLYAHNVDPALLAEHGASATQSFYNFFFTITGFHGFHVFSGVVINILILVNAINGVYERRGHYEMVEKVGLYWHFVDLVWVFVFTCFYLL